MICEEYYERECLLRQYMEYDEKSGKWVPIDKEAVRKNLERQKQKEKNIDLLEKKAVELDAFSDGVLFRVLMTDFKECAGRRFKSPFVAQRIHNRVNRERFAYFKKIRVKSR